MDDNGQSVSRASADADFLEWNFSIMAESSPWSVEQGVTQLLAHQSAEGFGPPLAKAVQDDAKVIHELGRRPTPTAVAALRAFQAMSTVDTQRELARMTPIDSSHRDCPSRPGLPGSAGYESMAAGGRTTRSTRARSWCVRSPMTELTNTSSWP